MVILGKTQVFWAVVLCANIKLNKVVYIKLQNKSVYQYFCTFTRVKLKKKYFYCSNILLYVSVLLLKYLICVLCPPLSTTKKAEKQVNKLLTLLRLKLSEELS